MANLVAVEWVAERLGESEHAVYRMVRGGIIPHVKLGRKTKFDPEAVDAWIRAGGTCLPGGWKMEKSTENAAD